MATGAEPPLAAWQLGVAANLKTRQSPLVGPPFSILGATCRRARASLPYPSRWGYFTVVMHTSRAAVLVEGCIVASACGDVPL